MLSGVQSVAESESTLSCAAQSTCSQRQDQKGGRKKAGQGKHQISLGTVLSTDLARNHSEPEAS